VLLTEQSVFTPHGVGMHWELIWGTATASKMVAVRPKYLMAADQRETLKKKIVRDTISERD
jgi:hypothetical protein